MTRRFLTGGLPLVLVALSALHAAGQTIDRVEVALKDTWKLQDFYSSDQAWADTMTKVAA